MINMCLFGEGAACSRAKHETLFTVIYALRAHRHKHANITMLPIMSNTTSRQPYYLPVAAGPPIDVCALSFTPFHGVVEKSRGRDSDNRQR